MHQSLVNCTWTYLCQTAVHFWAPLSNISHLMQYLPDNVCFSPQLWEVYKDRRCIRTFIGKDLLHFKSLYETNIICKLKSLFIIFFLIWDVWWRGYWRMVFMSALSCLSKDCLQPRFCLSAPSKNMHYSAAPELRGDSPRGGHEMQRTGSIGREKRGQSCPPPSDF